jgi:general secretion pathway protein G
MRRAPAVGNRERDARNLALRTAARPLATGFTLIELAIVMATIALLLTLALPRYFHTIEQGKVNVQRQNIATIRDAIDKFYGDRARYPDTLEELVRARYLRAVPVDPLTDAPDWVVVAPHDPALGGVYDVRSAVRKAGPNDEAS